MVALADSARRFVTIKARHSEVYEDNVWFELVHRGDAGEAVING